MFPARTLVVSCFAASLLVSSSAKAVADDLPFDSLTLVAIVMGDTPRAMLTDPTSRGWIVKRGDLVGRTERGGAPCRWRVTDVHRDSVVFARNDPQCAAAPRTKTLTLTH